MSYVNKYGLLEKIFSILCKCTEFNLLFVLLKFCFKLNFLFWKQKVTVFIINKVITSFSTQLSIFNWFVSIDNIKFSYIIRFSV